MSRRRAPIALAVLALVLLSRPALAAVTLVSHTIEGSGGTGDTFTTPAINTGSATLIVIGITEYAGTTNTLSDSQSNTWTCVGPTTTGNATQNRVCYVASPTTNGSHTFTLTCPSPCYGVLAVAAFAGTDTVPYDQDAVSGGTSGSSKQPGSITPSVNNELVVSVLTWENTDTVAVDSSMTITDQMRLNLPAAVHYSGALAYIVQTSAAAINPNWSWTNAEYSVARVSSFKEAAAAGGTVRRLMLTGVGQ